MVNTPEKNGVDAQDKEKLVHVTTATGPDQSKTTEVDQKLRELEDPLCSPNNVQKITFQDVTTAAFLIKGGVEYTPCSVEWDTFIGFGFELKQKFFPRDRNYLVSWEWKFISKKSFSSIREGEYALPKMVYVAQTVKPFR